MNQEIKERDVFRIPYPYIRSTYTNYDGEGFYEAPSWKPGTKWETRCTGYGEAGEYAVAESMGYQILTVVSIHRPGKYPTRVFFTRQWETPDGQIFGKKTLRIKASSAFKRDLRGYRHPFSMRVA